MNDRTELIEFMQIDCDYYTEKPQQQHNRMEGEKEETGKPVIRLFGVNAQGNSVCAHVHNFTAYFFIHIVERDNLTISAEDLEAFRLLLNSLVSACDAVLEIEIVEKYPVMLYQKQKQKFLKVYCSHPQFVSRLRQYVEKGNLPFGQDARDCLS